MSTFLNSCHSYLPQFLLFLPSSISSISYLPQFLPFLPSSISSISTFLNSIYTYPPHFFYSYPPQFLLFLPSLIPSIPTLVISSIPTLPISSIPTLLDSFYSCPPPYNSNHIHLSPPHSPCVFYYVYVGVTPRHLNTLICLFIFKPGTTTLYSYPIFLPFSYRVTYCALYI